ncbi:hypothetical protein [Pseudarthrobacter sp. PS3-L1]|uniref:hypothetical protein n=1 Tax=Pseudarthrobacter sp. PS3-L1 TaxID=3046207 RepID=UPI0024B9F83A|nr:hypothetical protein [Pseudarthrobacter sp. PS3-L1]MDJ0320647.1 hypothetical protein [Pseudarthrobacter sp. PS3-L1]
MKARGTLLSRRGSTSAADADWTVLRPGDQVEIAKHAQTVATGEVEEVSQSGNVIWLVADGQTDNPHFTKSDGIVIRKIP